MVFTSIPGTLSFELIHFSKKRLVYFPGILESNYYPFYRRAISDHCALTIGPQKSRNEIEQSQNLWVELQISLLEQVKLNSKNFLGGEVGAR